MINKNKTLLIGEIGINHNGDLKLAKKMIVAAKNSGFDLVKFQKRNPDMTTPKNKKNVLRDTPWGRITYLDYKKKIEFNETDYQSINAYCKKIGIKWFASAWDLESLKFLKKFKLQFNKVASPMLTNIKLIDEIAKEKKLTFISTGMSSFKDIDVVLKLFKKRKCKFILLHCVSTYPAHLKNLNLKMIMTLKKKYKCEVGYSGHEKYVSPSVFARVLGAKVIERHITIDRTLWGTDQAVSLEPDGMKSLVDMIRKFEVAFGNGKKVFLKEEKEKLNDMKYW
jgi:N-acetylneuraminate synthase